MILTTVLSHPWTCLHVASDQRLRGGSDPPNSRSGSAPGEPRTNRVLNHACSLSLGTSLQKPRLHVLIRIILNRIGMRVSAVHMRNPKLD